MMRKINTKEGIAMKNRNGFVSNSSSASFVIQWRMRTMGEEVSIKQSLSRLYECYAYDIDKDDFDWEKEYDKGEEFKEKFETIIENTKQMKDGSFVTSAHTNMLNSYDSLGTEIQSLVFALVADECFEIMDSKLDHDS